MQSKFRIVISALAVTALLLTAALWHQSKEPAARAYRFEVGVQNIYSFVHTQDGHVEMGVGSGRPSTTIASSARLNLEFSIVGLNETERGQDLRLTLTAADVAALSIAGQNVLPESDELLDAVAEIHLAPDNTFTELSFAEGTPAAARRLMQLFLTELQTTLPASPSLAWQSEETTQHGVAVSDYRISGEGLKRSRSSYRSLQAMTSFQGTADTTEVQGSALVDVAQDGRLRSLTAKEFIAALGQGKTLLRNHQTTEIRFVTERPLSDAPEILAMSAPRTLSAPIFSLKRKDNILRQRAKGMTVAKVTEDLAKMGAAERQPHHNAWFVRSIAALTLEPEGVEQLRSAYNEAKTFKTKELVLDLLAWTGHDRAQELLVDLVDSPKTRGHPSGHGLVQRLSMVQRPNHNVLDFVAREAFAEPSRYQIGALYAAGSVARKAIDTGTPEQARRATELSGHLLAALHEAANAQQRAHLVSALSNLARTEHESAIIEQAEASEEVVRLHVASALAKVDSPAARAALIRLSQDPGRAVQQRALAALVKHRNIQDLDLQQLAQAVRQGNIREEVLPVLVNAVVPYTTRSRAARPVLEAIVARDFEGDPSAKNRAHLLLARPQTL